VFRHYDYSTGQTSYFYRTAEQLVGKCLKPLLIKKNYRLGSRCLQPLNLLQLLKNLDRFDKRSTQLPFSKPKQTFSSDFQEHLITHLLFFCETAQFVQVPLEQEQVPQEVEQKDFTKNPDRVSLKSVCNQNILAHFKSKPLLHFTFSLPAVPLVLQFLDHLDNLAHQFEITSSADFYT